MYAANEMSTASLRFQGVCEEDLDRFYHAI